MAVKQSDCGESCSMIKILEHTRTSWILIINMQTKNGKSATKIIMIQNSRQTRNKNNALKHITGSLYAYVWTNSRLAKHQLAMID